MIELLREANGNQMEVSRRIGKTVGSVNSLIQGIRAKGRMPADLDELLQARHRSGRPTASPAEAPA
jgi:hypothetical protein